MDHHHIHTRHGSTEVRIIDILALIIIGPTPHLINRLIFILGEIRIISLRILLHIRIPKVRLLALLHDTRCDNVAEGLHAVGERGYGHVVGVVYHCAAGATIDFGPAVDRPGTLRDLAAKGGCGGYAFGLGGLHGAIGPVHVDVRSACLSGFDLAGG